MSLMSEPRELTEPKELTRHKLFVARLDSLLKLYKVHPELLAPYLSQLYAFPETKEELFAIAKAVGRKVRLGAYAQVRIDIDDGLVLLFSVARDKVCERVQVGTRQVTRDVTVKTGTEVVDEPVYKWVCPPELGAEESTEDQS
jgi:hypothetical protein